MPSDRMMQAIGRLERAVSRMEQVALPRSTAETEWPDREKAAQALQALDTLLDDLKRARHG